MNRTAPLLTALTTTFAVISACGNYREQDPDEPVEPLVSGLAECPHTWNWREIAAEREGEGANLVPRTVGSNLTVPGVHQNVPEYHDCQRFMVPDPRREGELQYDSIFAIFSAPDPPGGGTLHAAAQIYSENSYAPLGIDAPGFSCLYMFHGDGSQWNAKMVSYGPTEVDCTAATDTSALPAGTDLEVQASTMTGGAPVHYPAVARWDWDAVNSRHYIGIRCGPARWCEVGAAGFAASPNRADHSNPAWPPERRRVFEVKGWYDEQFLAEPSSSSPTGVRPTRIRGTIFPDPLLGTYNSISDFDDHWVQTAQIALDNPDSVPNPYQAKLNLAATVPGGRLNTVWLCHGASGPCPGVPPALTSCDGSWRVRIVNAQTGLPKYGCVIRRTLPSSIDVVATARWRWLLDDEGHWERCAQGCCEGQTGLM